jgi:hypothetical protein
VIENATVTISDDTGFGETSVYKGNGNYQTQQLKGTVTVGRTYSLKVTLGTLGLKPTPPLPLCRRQSNSTTLPTNRQTRAK